MSAASGINIQDEVIEKYKQLQTKKDLGFVIFKISDDNKDVVNDCDGPADCPFEEFTEKLPPKDCRYAVVDVKYDLGDSGKRQKICFIVWCPEEAPIKKKMIYASTKDSLKKKLTGLSAEYQADCFGDMKYSEILDKVKKAK